MNATTRGPITREVVGDTGRHYLVRFAAGRWTCTCPDHVYRNHECKHIRRIKQQEKSMIETTLPAAVELPPRDAPALRPAWTREQIELLKRTVARGASDDELDLFILICRHTGLDPFLRQIHALKRRENVEGRWEERMTFQTGIDGFRVMADRTGRYAPGREPTYAYDDKGHLVAATAYVRKQTPDGRWHEASATAHYREYVSLKKDGTPNRFWAEKPHVMLAKCAEALALRKAFPMQLSGVYTHEEIRDEPGAVAVEAPPAPPADEAEADPEPMTPEQGLEIDRLATEASYRPEQFRTWVRKIFGREVTELDHDQAAHLLVRLEAARGKGRPVSDVVTAGREPGEEG
jgi:phage recombination protein Bet